MGRVFGPCLSGSREHVPIGTGTGLRNTAGMETMITDEQFNAAVDKYRTSRHRNPGVEDGVCLYTAANGKHCVAGQIMADLGLPVPEYTGKDGVDDPNGQTIGSSSLVPFTERLTEKQISCLASAQAQADEGIEWRSALSGVRV